MLRCVWAVALLVILPAGIAGGQEAADIDELYAEWERAVSLRERNDPAGAEDVLRGIIADHPDETAVLKRAYHELVFTRLLDGREGTESAAAREALARFPDITADPIYVPATVNTLYDQERRRMYGALSVRKPEGVLILIDDVEVGASPWFEPYWPVGTYTLTLVRDGYHDLVQEITVEPDGSHHLELTMERRKDFGYWATRIGGGIVAAGVVAGVVVATTGSSSSSPTALAGPPPPP